MLSIDRIKAVHIPKDQELRLYDLQMLLREAKAERDPLFCIVSLSFKAGFLRGTGYAARKGG